MVFVEPPISISLAVRPADSAASVIVVSYHVFVGTAMRFSNMPSPAFLLKVTVW
ncbi:MAG: hypothetical protein LBJ35_05840 [Spirochaetaceae bacterium]|nr:hypothetical protein [Spirochaetaceae bacterium]